MKYKCISADSHLEIRPDRYCKRVPEKYRDRAPKVITLEDGTLAVLQEGQPLERLISNISCGSPTKNDAPSILCQANTTKRRPAPVLPSRGLPNRKKTASMPRYFPRQRRPWVLARHQKRRRVYIRRACLQRLACRGVLLPRAGPSHRRRRDPDHQCDDAVAELHHCKKIGLKTVIIDNFPAGQRYPTRTTIGFWAAAVDLDMPLTIHVEFGFPRRSRGLSRCRERAGFKYAKQPDPEHHVPDVIERFNKYGFRGSKQVVQMIWGGAFERFPRLNIYVAEVQIGWVPNWMDQMDNEYGRQQYWAERVLGLPRLKRMPSEIAREHFYWGFNRNPVGVRIARQEMGVDKIMWASDFPHLESDWPNSRRVMAENFAGVAKTKSGK